MQEASTRDQRRLGALECRVHRCGRTILAVYLLLAALSYAIAPAAPFGAQQPLEAQMLSGWAESLPVPGAVRSAIAALVGGDTPFESPVLRIATFGGAMAVVTVCACLLLAGLAQRREEIDARLIQTLRRYGFAFAAVNVLAYPMFTQDFWLSVIWGRMLADGVSPYFYGFTEASLAGLPVEPFKMRMTYGPLWTAASGALAVVGGRVPFVEFLLHKALLLGAWCLAFQLVDRIHAAAPMHRRAAALALFGWLPISLHFTLAEGHNDVAMVAGMLGWFLLLKRRRHALAPFALAASALFKYVSAPLLALDLLAGWHTESRRRSLAALGAAVVLTLGVIAIFSTEGSIFEETAGMTKLEILTPRYALAALGRAVEFRSLTPYGDQLVLGALLVGVWPALRRQAMGLVTPTSKDVRFDDLAELALFALLCASLIFVGHTWPWFLQWPFAAAVVVPSSRLLGWILPLFLVAPFFSLLWAGTGWSHAALTSMLVYGAAALLIAPTRRWLRPALV